MTHDEKLTAVMSAIEPIKKADDLNDREKLLVAYIEYQQYIIGVKEQYSGFQDSLIDVLKK